MDRTDVLIEADELLKKAGDGNLRIYDATIVDDIYMQGHIPGAVFFDHARFSDPNGRYEYTISPEALLAEQIGKAGIANDSEVIVYACGMLPYAIRAWWVLRYAGHNNVRVLNGGIDAWKAAGGQVEQKVNQYEPVRFTARFTPGMFSSKEEIMASMDDDDVATINVMPLVSYEGKHIVGSTCLPCLDLMEGMDTLLPDEQLAARLSEASNYKRIITYCGGGIAATVNAAAHLITGHTNVGVYDGSLYEWLGEGLPTKGSGVWEVWKKEEVKAGN